MINKNKFKDSELDESKIPSGPYCYSRVVYTKEGLDIDLCPYWDHDPEKKRQEDGYCHFIKAGDWEDGWGLIWDCCKECNKNYSDDCNN